MIQIDVRKYLREVIVKFDMVGEHPSSIPAPAGMKIYTNENWDGDEKFRKEEKKQCPREGMFSDSFAKARGRDEG